MKIEIIIPNYNGFKLIKNNLPSVIKSLKDYKNSLVTIVDDGSVSKEQELLKSYVEQISKNSRINVVLRLFEKNKGFSSNVNRAALVSDADIIVLLNSDVSPNVDFLKFLLPYFKDDEVFGVGCMDESIETKTVLRGRGLASWRRGFLVHRKGEVNRNDTFWVSGGSSAFNRKLFQKLGGMDTLYDPFYWEDIDLSYRAQKAGYKIYFENKSVVIHRHSKGSIKKHYDDKVIKSYAMRNQFTFIWKNITDISLLISHILFLPYYLFKAALNRDSIFLKGFFLAILRVPDIMKHRNNQKKLYVFSDKEVINKYQNL